MNQVIVIGGGAAGMMAALTAAEDKTNRVLLLERQSRVGRKLLATGNGRCNLTNIGAAIDNYHGEDRDFAAPALTRFTPRDTLDFFHALGLLTVTEPSGRVYPLSDSANSVVDVLRFALAQRGVDVRCGCPVRDIRREKTGYTVVCDEETLHADDLIVACGGAAGAKLGGVMDGYQLLKPLGHKRTALYPSLVQLLTGTDYPRSLKGVRADSALRLCGGNDLLAESGGELQFTEKGVSGPAAFDISRAAATGGEGLTLHVDFLRQIGKDELLQLLRSRCETFPKLESAELLTGMLHNRLGRMLLKAAGAPQGVPLAALTEGQLAAVAAICKDFTLPVTGTEGFDHAQVTAGGIRTAGFNRDTLESWFMPRLFVCGELLDIDGDCGGFNLQWAWASGRMAGRLGR